MKTFSYLTLDFSIVFNQVSFHECMKSVPLKFIILKLINMFHKFDSQKVTQTFVFTLNNICIVLYLYITNFSVIF